MASLRLLNFKLVEQADTGAPFIGGCDTSVSHVVCFPVSPKQFPVRGQGVHAFKSPKSSPDRFDNCV